MSDFLKRSKGASNLLKEAAEVGLGANVCVTHVAQVIGNQVYALDDLINRQEKGRQSTRQILGRAGLIASKTAYRIETTTDIETVLNNPQETLAGEEKFRTHRVAGFIGFLGDKNNIGHVLGILRDDDTPRDVRRGLKKYGAHTVIDANFPGGAAVMKNEQIAEFIQGGLIGVLFRTK